MSSAEIAVEALVWRELVEHYGSAVAAVQALIFSEAP